MDLIHKFIREIPKCELHLHIEGFSTSQINLLNSGTLSPELLLRLAAKNKIVLPEIYSSLPALKDRYENFSDLQDFLNFYYQGIAVLQDESDYEGLAFEYFCRAHADGIHHAEIFFDIQTHTSRSISHDTVVNGLSKGLNRANQSFGITSDLIVCFVRHIDEASALKEFAALEKYFDSGEIIGIGMDSTELPHPPENFSRLYAEADKKGLRKCAHAGEEGPPSYIRTVIDHLNVHRVDHGIRAIDDPELCKELARRKIPLTVCPLSNVKLQCIPSLAHSPIPQFLEIGMLVTINSDDPAYFGGYLLDNMLALQSVFNWDHKIWQTLCLNGIEASFCSEERKSELKAVLDKAIAMYNQS
jgi:adenosine deaminase